MDSQVFGMFAGLKWALMFCRPYWRCYYANTDGIVFVVDSADVDRANTAKTELSSMLQEDELKSAPLLILANKQVP